MKRSYLILLIGLSIGFAATGCSTPRLQSPAELAVFGDHMTESEYKKLLQRHTKKARGYSGLHNVFHFEAIMMTEEIIGAVARRKALFYQWTEDELRDHLESELQSTSSKTKVFISFYTPERSHDDLNSANSMWRLYLQAGNRRYSGNARKLADPVAQISSIYPFHDMWSSAYEVDFLIPSSQLNLGEVKFTVTGALGAAQVAFKRGR